MNKLLSALILVSLFGMSAAYSRSSAQPVASKSYVQQVVEQTSLRCRGGRCGRRGAYRGSSTVQRGGCQGGSCRGGRCGR